MLDALRARILQPCVREPRLKKSWKPPNKVNEIVNPASRRKLTPKQRRHTSSGWRCIVRSRTRQRNWSRGTGRKPKPSMARYASCPPLSNA